MKQFSCLMLLAATVGCSSTNEVAAVAPREILVEQLLEERASDHTDQTAAIPETALERDLEPQEWVGPDASELVRKCENGDHAAMLTRLSDVSENGVMHEQFRLTCECGDERRLTDCARYLLRRNWLNGRIYIGDSDKMVSLPTNVPTPPVESKPRSNGMMPPIIVSCVIFVVVGIAIISRLRRKRAEQATPDEVHDNDNCETCRNGYGGSGAVIYNDRPTEERLGTEPLEEFYSEAVDDPLEQSSYGSDDIDEEDLDDDRDNDPV